MVLLSYGTTFSPDGFAINDFETMADGEATTLTIGVSVNGGCAWQETTTYPR